MFIETKANKRIVHNRSTKFPARTVITDLEDSIPVEKYSLQAHIEKLETLKDEVASFEL